MTTILEKLNNATGGAGRKIFNSYILQATKDYQKKYGFDIGEGQHATWNNEADAFKHAYMQWVLDYYFDSDVATKLGNMHEDETPNADIGERNMDLWNNSIGREIADEMQKLKDGISFESAKDIAARKIVEKLRNGELITTPNDPRKFENMELERLTDKDKVHYKNEFAKYKEPLSDDVLERYLEQAIDNDWTIPDKASLDKRVQKGELIYVESYTKADGTEISGYYRRRPVR